MRVPTARSGGRQRHARATRATSAHRLEDGRDSSLGQPQGCAQAKVRVGARRATAARRGIGVPTCSSERRAPAARSSDALDVGPSPWRKPGMISETPVEKSSSRARSGRRIGGPSGSRERRRRPIRARGAGTPPIQLQSPLRQVGLPRHKSGARHDRVRCGGGRRVAASGSSTEGATPNPAQPPVAALASTLTLWRWRRRASAWARSTLGPTAS